MEYLNDVNSSRIILYSEDECEKFLTSKWRDKCEVLALCPAVRSKLKKEGIEHYVSTDFFGDKEQKECADYGYEIYFQIIEKLEKALHEYQGLVVSFSYIFYTILVISYRLNCLLEGAKSWIVWNGKAFIIVNSKDQAHQLLVKKIVPESSIFSITEKQLSCIAFLFSSIRNLVIKYFFRGYLDDAVLLPRKKQHLVIKNYIADRKNKVITLEPNHLNLKETIIYFFNLLKNRFAESKATNITLYGYSLNCKKKKAEEISQQILSINSAELSHAILPVKSLVEGKLAQCISLAENYKDVVKLFPKNTQVMTVESNELKSAILNSVALLNDLKIINVNHNSLPAPSNRVSRKVMEVIIRSRIVNNTTHEFMSWSRHTADYAKELDKKLIVTPLKSDYPALKKEKYFHILYASNGVDYNHFYPLIIETSDEFADAILGFLEVIAPSEAMRFTIRLRDKSEFNRNVLLNLSTASAIHSQFLRVENTQSDFLEQLATADLLVAYMSSTVEQALQMRIPVLLWGPTVRHEHLSAQSSLPTPESRSAIYVVYKKEMLMTMINSIRDVHGQNKLTDEDLKRHLH